MTTSYKPPCGFMGCDPVKGQCIGFCNNGMPVQMHEPDSYFEFPESEDEADQDMISGMQMLAYVILFTGAVTVCTVASIWFFR